MRKHLTVSVGIPAFNEGGNIKSLLASILKQTTSNFTLVKIYVISDGSTDQTQTEVASLKNSKIFFKDDKKRLGKSARLEEIFRLNTADVLLLMDADIVIKDTELITKLVDAVDFEKTGIAAINAQPLPATTFFARVLNTSVFTTKKIAEQWNKGDNYLSFKGCFLALSGKFVKNLHIPGNLVNNDAYLYFAAKKANFATEYVKNCVAYYHSPQSMADHIKQSSRFQLSRQELSRIFPKEILTYSPPRYLFYKSSMETLFTKPLYFLTYVGIHMISKVGKQTEVNPTWKIASSTKQKFVTNN